MKISLNATDIAALLPLLVILAGALSMLLLESFAERVSKKYSIFLTLLILLLGLGATMYAPISHSPLLTPWLRFDWLAKCFTFFFMAVGIGSTLLSRPFFQRFNATRGEYYFFLLASVFGLILIGAAADLLTLFLGLETLSIALYVWVGYIKHWSLSREASIKYFIMGSVAAAFLLYGFALVYGAVGTTRLNLLLDGYKALPNESTSILFMAGIAFITLGLAFKAAIVPFHFWAPDVYSGAPTPVTAFMAVGTKAGAFAAFAVIFLLSLSKFNPLWNEALALLTYPTLIYANILALRQTQLRRFFAYSGIAHAGFLLIPLAAGTPDALSALLFYLIIYSLATLGCFAVLSFLDETEEGVTLHDLKGLFGRSPFLALTFAICLLTLGGIPPTAGFFAKLYVFFVAFQGGYYGLVIVGLLTAVLSAYYYLRIVALMFAEAPNELTLPRTKSAGLMAILSLTAIIVLSIVPNWLIQLL